MPDVAVPDMSSASDEELYDMLYKTAESLVEGERDYIANTANISALIYHTFKERTDVRKGVNWVGFYLNRKGNQLVLGPFQGKVACIRIPFGKGVCGDAAKDKQTKLVKNVHDYPGHIACDSASNSEIVVPVIGKDGRIIGVFDLDNASVAGWNEADQRGLEKIAALVASACDWPF